MKNLQRRPLSRGQTIAALLVAAGMNGLGIALIPDQPCAAQNYMGLLGINLVGSFATMFLLVRLWTEPR